MQANDKRGHKPGGWPKKAKGRTLAESHKGERMRRLEIVTEDRLALLLWSDDGDPQRFARLFAATWRALPEGVLAHFRRPMPWVLDRFAKMGHPLGPDTRVLPVADVEWVDDEELDDGGGPGEGLIAQCAGVPGFPQHLRFGARCTDACSERVCCLVAAHELAHAWQKTQGEWEQCPGHMPDVVEREVNALVRAWVADGLLERAAALLGGFKRRVPTRAKATS